MGAVSVYQAIRCISIATYSYMTYCFGGRTVVVMAPDQSGQGDVSFEEIDRQIGRQRLGILSLLSKSGQSLDTGKIRKETGVPRGSINHHLGKLQSWGLVEQVGRTSVGRGDPAWVWELTDRGAEYMDTEFSEERVGDGERIAELEQRVDELEQKVEKLAEMLM